MTRTVLFPLPDRDFDVTEVAVPWHLLRSAGHEVVFATETGATPAADPLLLTGVLFGEMGAQPEPIRFYRELEDDAAFREPVSWGSADWPCYDALFLAGGHAQGMKQYLASRELTTRVAEFWKSERPVAAICHGVIVLARARDPETGKSPLFGRKTTCLPKYMERTAYFLTAWKLGGYYRTYPEYVEDEVRSALADPADLQRGPFNLTSRGTQGDDSAAFVVEDGPYLSARWPGDAYLIAKRLIQKLEAMASG